MRYPFVRVSGMVRIVFASFRYKKGFTILEIAITIILITLLAIGLINTVILYMNKSLLLTLHSHMVDAATNLIAYPEKISSCESISNPCSVFNTTNCYNSINCNKSYCYRGDYCVICYENPNTGKTFFYGLKTQIVSTGNYTIVNATLCRYYSGSEIKSFLLHIR